MASPLRLMLLNRSIVSLRFLMIGQLLPVPIPGCRTSRVGYRESGPSHQVLGWRSTYRKWKVEEFCGVKVRTRILLIVYAWYRTQLDVGKRS
jgi:hypothetical protein